MKICYNYRWAHVSHPVSCITIRYQSVGLVSDRLLRAWQKIWYKDVLIITSLYLTMYQMLTRSGISSEFDGQWVWCIYWQGLDWCDTNLYDIAAWRFVISVTIILKWVYFPLQLTYDWRCHCKSCWVSLYVENTASINALCIKRWNILTSMRVKSYKTQAPQNCVSWRVVVPWRNLSWRVCLIHQYIPWRFGLNWLKRSARI